MANPLGPSARGWAAVSRRLKKRPPPCGTPRHYRSNGSAVVTADLAYTVEIEHYQGQQFAGSDERHDFDLRVTTIFRREPVGWRIVHRHADGITTDTLNRGSHCHSVDTCRARWRRIIARTHRAFVGRSALNLLCLPRGMHG
jgi:ketosteroid isomerase-like protein